MEATFESIVVRYTSMKAPCLHKTSQKAIQQDFPNIILNVQIDKVHSWVKRLFKNSNIQENPLAGRLLHFVKNWQIVTKASQGLQSSSLVPEVMAQFLITNWPREGGLAGVVNKRLILSDVL